MTDAGGTGTRVVLLGTAGGPLPSPVRSGIAQAVVVGGAVYLVDCGSGVTRQLRRARLLSGLAAVFITHLHSDHICDYFNLFSLGWPILQRGPLVRVVGPGPAGALPPDPVDAAVPVPVVAPSNPTPGLAEMTRRCLEAAAYDVNVRMREAGRRDLRGLFDVAEIAVPAELGASAVAVAPDMAPLAVFEDDRVRVTAVLVQHAPVFPAFAYRFDTDDGAVVVSGDTAPCANLVQLASGADLLVHEVVSDAGFDGADDEDSREERWQQHHLRTSHTPLRHVGKVAAEAGARRLVLTHFVPGDDVLPDEHWHGGLRDYDGEVVVGHDLGELGW